MPETTRPPILIWITQFLLFVFAVPLLAAIIFMVRRIWAGVHVPAYGLAAGGVLFVMIVVSLIAFWDLMNRRKSGKWLASASLIVPWAIFVVIALMPVQDYGQARSGQFRITYNPSFEDRVYLQVSLIWLHVLILGPAIGLLFSKKVDRFLDKPAGK